MVRGKGKAREKKKEEAGRRDGGSQRPAVRGRTVGASRFCVESWELRSTLRRVSSPEKNLSELHLVQRCVENDEAAIALLQSTYGGRIVAFLVGAGAGGEEARETVKSLWADCLTPPKRGTVRLLRYNGECELQTFLNRVALNSLLTRKRIDGRRLKNFPPSESPEPANAFSDEPPPETMLLEIMRDAVQFAFEHCTPEEFVILNLEHYDELERAELARMFGCSKATVSRLLDKARVTVAENTMAFLRRRDPWLELKWEDFLELCRTTTPACFGIED